MEANKSPLMTPPQVCALLQVSKPHLYRLMQNQNFPKPRYLSKRCPRWERQKVLAWLEGNSE